jgi:pimeloyl-ACP methyl ester carboxylesterase
MREMLARNVGGVLSSDLMRPPDVAAPSLAQITVPTLVIVGAQDDPEIVQRAERLRAGIPGARKAVIPEAGHLVSFEQPAAFNRMLDAFLK